jgi:hypothetical protein
MIEMYVGMFSGGWAIDGHTQAWSVHEDPVAALESWAAVIERQRSSRWRKAGVTLWLSGGLARPFLCGPVAGLASWGEADAMASAMALEATGFDGPCQVRLEDWPGDAVALCTAVDAAVVDAIFDIARRRRLVWSSVRPRWAGLLNEVLAQQPTVGLVACDEEDALTILGGAARTGGETTEAFELATTLSPAPVADRLTALWNRTMLSRDVRPEDVWFARLAIVNSEPSQAGVLENSRVPWPDVVRQGEVVSP